MSDERQAVAAGITRLVSWAHGISFDAIPQDALRRAGRILADDLAAIVAARNEAEVAAFHQCVLKRAKEPEATIFRGGRPRTDRLSAAAANAVAADWLEVDEGYRKVPCHAGLYTVPALIAEAEATHLAVKDLLRALVVAYEVVTRVARAWSAPGVPQHPHSRYCAIGASAAVGLARQLDQKTLCAAVSAAATMIQVGPRDHAVQGTLVRNVWPACGAWNGMMSVEWAQCGIGGVAAGFHDVYSSVLGNAALPEQLTQGLGESWAVLDSYAKLYACCQQTHSAVEASFAVREQLLAHASMDAVDSVTLETFPLAMPLVNYAPSTTLAAKFSLPHVIASALMTGTAGVEAFAARTLDAADIGALRNKVWIVPFESPAASPNDRPARITVRLADGREFRQECLSAQGGADRPFSDLTLMRKIAGLTEPAYPKLLPVMESVMRLEADRIGQSWTAVVAEICEGSG